MLIHTLVVVLLGAAPRPPLKPDDATLFKALFARGEKRYAEGDYRTALWSFKRADELWPTPEVAFDLARTAERLGDEPYAAYYLGLYLRRSPGAPDALDVARQIADLHEKAALAGRGLLEVEARERGSVTVGARTYEELPIAALLPPGDYELVGQLASGPVRRRISVRVGASTFVDLLAAQVSDLPALEVQPMPVAPPVLPPPALAVEELAAPPADSARARWHVASVVGVAVGLTGLVAGVAMGAMSRGDVTRYERDRSSLTRTEAQALLQTAGGRATAATALMAGGGALTAAGGVTFILTLPEPGMATP